MEQTSLPLSGVRLPRQKWSGQVRRILLMRALRSFSQGYLNVLVPLYLTLLGLSAKELGLVVSASFVVGAALLVPVGRYADRVGRKPVLVGFTVLIAVWGVLYAVSTNLVLLIGIGVIAGLGRGGAGAGTGQGGAFGPVEQALLADLAPPPYQRRTFLWDAFLTAACTGVGAEVSGIVSTHARFSFLGLNGERTLFLLTAVIGLASLCLLWSVPEPNRETGVAPPEQTAPTSATADTDEDLAGPGGPMRFLRPTRNRAARSSQPMPKMSKVSIQLAQRQALSEAANTFGLGFVNSLFVIWLYERFHVDASVIGPILSLTYGVQAACVWVAAVLANRLGPVKVVVYTRGLAALLVLLTAIAPTVFIAGALQVLRTAVATMATPVRQSFMFAQFSPWERARAASAVGLVRRVPAAVSPTLSGWLFTAGLLEMPFYISGVFQVVSAYLYYRYFSALDE